MDYTEALNRIHALNKFGSRPGLDRVKKLLDLMGNPQDSLRFVHVAGTNGKGSTCAMVSSVLVASGYRTGLFISPYITDFCERIQIDSTPIDRAELANVAEYVFALTDKLNAEGIIITEFEFVMCVAFEYFKRQCCDIVVLEVGLGGELDCTNVIKPPVCAVITRIGLDHTDILGDTVELIAAQKCGIIKEGTTVVSSPQREDAAKVIEKVCREKNVGIRFSDSGEFSQVESSISGTSFVYRGERLKLHLVGEHQLQNAATALCAIEVLVDKGFDRINMDAIKCGLENATNPARFEAVSLQPAVVIDGAHNPDGVSTFAESVKKYLGDRKGVLIIGMLSDKDSRSSVEYLQGLFDRVYTVPIDNPRAMTSVQMAEICSQYFENVEACGSVEEAFDKAYSEAIERQTHVCVCGSLYLAGEIRPYAINKIRRRQV